MVNSNKQLGKQFDDFAKGKRQKEKAKVQQTQKARGVLMRAHGDASSGTNSTEVSSCSLFSSVVAPTSSSESYCPPKNRRLGQATASDVHSPRCEQLRERSHLTGVQGRRSQPATRTYAPSGARLPILQICNSSTVQVPRFELAPEACGNAAKEKGMRCVARP